MADVAVTIESGTTWSFQSKGCAGSISLSVAPEGGQWRGAWSAALPDANGSGGDLAPTRDAAFLNARETCISWLGDQKGHGSKRNRQTAEDAQVWALTLAAVEEAPAAEPAALEAAAPQWFPLEKLRESPLNPRQFIPEAGIVELAESMRANGFRAWLPIVARPCGDGFAEMAAGHRRRLGALRAGLTQVPVVLRPMSDEEFLEVLNFDNSGREDVHPLHEAAGWHDWMARTGKGVLDIAARIGKSKEYVYQRLKYAELIPEAREAFLEKKFTADHAVRIARRTPEVQKKALVFMAPRWNGQIPTTRELDNWLHDSTTDLATAPFDRSDATLVAPAGSCAVCLKMSANDPAAGEESEGRELCQDPLCYEKKLSAHLVQIEERLKAAGTPVVRVSNHCSTQKKGVLARGAFEPLPAGREDAKAPMAVVVEGPGMGTTMRVRVSTPAAGAGKAAGSPAKAKALADASAARVKEKRAAELAVRERILDACLVKSGGALSTEDLRALLAASVDGGLIDTGVDVWLCRRHGVAVKADKDYEASRKLLAALPKMAPRAISDLAIEFSVLQEFDEYAMDRTPVLLSALAKRYKVDAAKVRATVEGERKAAAGQVAGKSAKVKVPAAKKASAKKAPAKKGKK
jgi:ParB family transcriptional regulator, chromosome partitioning protein